MREIRTSGSEGGARLNPLSLPLSTRTQQTSPAGVRGAIQAAPAASSSPSLPNFKLFPMIPARHLL